MVLVKKYLLIGIIQENFPLLDFLCGIYLAKQHDTMNSDTIIENSDYFTNLKELSEVQTLALLCEGSTFCSMVFEVSY